MLSHAKGSIFDPKKASPPLFEKNESPPLFSSALFKINLQEEKSSSPPTSTAVDPAEEAETSSHHVSKSSDLDETQKEEQQEVDWKEDEVFKKFMGNPSIQATLELEKKRIYRTIKEMERGTDGGNPVKRLWNNLVRDRLEGEKERLEKAEETFKALDLNKAG